MKIKISGISLFLLGVLTTLYLFGFNTPFLPKFQITYSIPGSWPELFTAICTFLAVLVALFGDWIRSLLFPSKILIIDKWQNIQNTQGLTRLLITNAGWSSAYEVEIHVTEIKDNNITRPGFLPVPLSWTHTNGIETKRNLYPKQFGYFIDLCRLDNINNTSIEPKIPLYFGSGINNYQNIYHGITTLELTITQKSGKMIIYNINLEWLRGIDKFVKVLNISRL